LDWDVVPKDGYDYEWVSKAIEEVKYFLTHPNKNNETFQSLIRAWVKDVLEVDAGIIVKVFDIGSYDFDEIEPKSGAPMLKPIGERKMTELYIRDGASFLKEIDKFGFLKGYWQYSYQIPAHPMWFNRDEIVYGMEHPRSMSCYGFARTQSILDIVKSMHYSVLYNKKFFEETAIPDGIVSLLDTNEVEHKAFLNYWNNEFRAQPHKLAVVNKDVKWSPLTASNRELEFLETQKWYFNMVISMFGLSPSELGITEDLTRATSATQAELVKRKGIRPFLKLFENFINMGIMPEFQYEGIEFQFIYDDPAEKSARLNNWKTELDMGVKTPNEVRNEMGMEPVDGGDITNPTANRMMFEQRNPQDTEPGAGPGASPEEEQEQRDQDGESPGYEDTVGREESRNKKRISDEDTEVRDRIHNPYGDAHRPVGNFKGVKPEGLTEAEEAGLQVESSEHPQLHVEVIMQLVRDHLKEDPNYYKKGVDDGQYYHDQPISMPRRPSGADFQPQNPKPTDNFPRDNSMRSQPVEYEDTNPSHLGDTYSQPQNPKHKWRRRDQIHCPMCGQPTLSVLNAMENLPEDIRCTQCGARFKTEDLLNAAVMEEMYNVVTANNQISPISIPEWKPKGFDKGIKDAEMDIKAFCGFDVSKSLPFSREYADSREYRNLLYDFLDDLSKDAVNKIITILKTSLMQHDTISDVSRKINKIIKDERRSDLIARSEIIRIGNEGNRLRMVDKGVQKVEFISAPEDGRLCSECKKHDGEIFTIDKIKGMIPLHCNCRCSFTEWYG
jgi:SPP1 gp7 family putative phage head morphogenesis protein